MRTPAIPVLALWFAFGLACAGTATPADPPPWLPGVALDGLSWRVGMGNEVVLAEAHSEPASIETRLEAGGWERQRVAWDETPGPGFVSRWRLDTEHWVDVRTERERLILSRLHWGPDAQKVPGPTDPPGRRLTGSRAQLAGAPPCTNGVDGAELDLELDGGFSYSDSGSAASGRWELQGDDLVLSGQQGASTFSYTCSGLVVWGSAHPEVLQCAGGHTWTCGVAAGPLVLVMDGGAGDPSANSVLRGLARDERPASGPSPLVPPGAQTMSRVYRAGASQRTRDLVEVLYRPVSEEARHRAERYAYRLDRDLDLSGVQVGIWDDAPAPFVVVVGGEAGMEDLTPQRIAEIDAATAASKAGKAAAAASAVAALSSLVVHANLDLPEGRALFALLEEEQGCSWVVVGTDGTTTQVARSDRCPDDVWIDWRFVIAQIDGVIVETSLRGGRALHRVEPAAERCELPYYTAHGVLWQVCDETVYVQEKGEWSRVSGREPEEPNSFHLGARQPCQGCAELLPANSVAAAWLPDGGLPRRD